MMRSTASRLRARARRALLLGEEIEQRGSRMMPRFDDFVQSPARYSRSGRVSSRAGSISTASG